MKHDRKDILKLGEEFKNLTKEQRKEYVDKVKNLLSKGYSIQKITEILGISETSCRMIAGED